MTLSIPGNKLTGILSTSIGFLRNLEYLDLSNNDLSGDVPSELALLTKLRKYVSCLYIYDNAHPQCNEHALRRKKS